MCVASSMRAMPENEKPPARPVDVYLPQNIMLSLKAGIIWVLMKMGNILFIFEKL